uniref:Uncharacterized protein n=1 Tax=Anguilla anguilla TaxID=7936 RepID=A0A0E9V582_ANGAN
MNTHLFTYLLM